MEMDELMLTHLLQAIIAQAVERGRAEALRDRALKAAEDVTELAEQLRPNAELYEAAQSQAEKALADRAAFHNTLVNLRDEAAHYLTRRPSKKRDADLRSAIEGTRKVLGF
jgi:hypothetical protein